MVVASKVKTVTGIVHVKSACLQRTENVLPSGVLSVRSSRLQRLGMWHERSYVQMPLSNKKKTEQMETAQGAKALSNIILQGEGSYGPIVNGKRSK